MIEIKSFVFNPFQENTYLLYTPEEAWIIDPGMYEGKEFADIFEFIASSNLNPTKLILTHAHIDHILGNLDVFEEYQLRPWVHESEVPFLVNVQEMAKQFGMPYVHQSPEPEGFLDESSVLELGGYNVQNLHTPGHSPGSLCFYIKEQDMLIGGDVLFRESIGRTDLPLCNEQNLYDSIRHKLYSLPDETVVYPGHGPITTIGHEKEHNPFVRP